jgi:methionine biosynthesis protein MetW
MPRTAAELRRTRVWAYENPRPDVQELVPMEASRILDLGCSSGRLGAALKSRQQAEVVGIELDPEYAREASSRLDEVVVASLEDDSTAADRLGEFDCLIAADVLEHLRDPWSTLSRFTELLRPGGTAVVSLPNVRYWETFWLLARYGVWPLRDEGLFDRDHLRWFTLTDAQALLSQAGLEVTRVVPRYRLRPSRPETERQARVLHGTPLAPFFTFQYVLTGLKTGPTGGC